MIYDSSNCEHLTKVIDADTKEEVSLVVSVDTEKMVLNQYTGQKTGSEYEVVERRLRSVVATANEYGIVNNIEVLFVK